MPEPILAAVVPILVTAGIGFWWIRSGRPFEGQFLTALVMDVGTPCLVFSTLARTEIPPEIFARTALASAVAMIGFAALGAALLGVLGLRLRVYLPSLTFPNSGNLGLPLALYAFGPEGLGYAIGFFTVCTVANFTIGQAVAAGSANWRGLLRMPITYACVLGALAAAFHLALPRWAVNVLSLLGSMTVPLMLLMLGASLARLRVAGIGRAGVITALRIGLGGLVAFAVAAAFGLAGTARAVFILQCANPVAVYNYLFALRWDNEPEEIAGIVVVSTFASMVTIPVLLHFLL